MLSHEPVHPNLATLGPLGMIVPLIIGAALVILAIYFAQYVYKDAARRNLNAELWLLIILIVPVISWIVYFIVRKTDTAPQMRDLSEAKK